jgi:DNA polymerase III delta prime subunit
MKSRPYFSFSGAKLKAAIEENRKNLTALQAIVEEISKRTKTKASLAPYLKKAKKYIAVIKAKPPKTKRGEDTKNPIPIGDPSPVGPEHDEPPDEDPAPPIKTQRGTLGCIREATNGYKGVPQVWSPEPKVTFPLRGIDEATTISERFISALGGLIWEIRKGAKFSKTINLVNGRKEKSVSGEHGYVYSFRYSGDDDFFEGARIEFRSGKRKSNGSIVSILSGNPKTIIVSLEEDFGNGIPQCSITQDEAALLEALQKRFEVEMGRANNETGSPVGMNLDIADALFSGDSRRLEVEDYNIIETGKLNERQSAFVEKAIRYSISALWGPPGTGKTQTLGALIAHFYKEQERTLICSNTNQAVDQVLLKLCRELVAQGKRKDLEDGKIVRVGRISLAELEEEFSQYVTVDGIAARKGSEITREIKRLEVDRAQTEQQLRENQGIIDAFEALDSLKKQEAEAFKAVSSIEEKIKSSLEDKQNQLDKAKELESEKANYKNKGLLSRAFSRGTDAIDTDIVRCKQKQSSIEQSLNHLANELQQAELNLPEIRKQIKVVEVPTLGHNLYAAQSVVEKTSVTASVIDGKLATLKKQMEDLRKVILSQATVLGATLTKTFLSPVDLGKFCNVVIDEASMGLLPAVYFTASQSQKRCVISGDFRQLPPIIQSKNKAILDEIGSDIFDFSGFEKGFESKEDCPYADVLREQYRMDPKICSLISKIGYEGELFTSARRKPNKAPSPKTFADSVIIVDTSPIYPFTDRDPFGSTSNMVHALIARNIMREFGGIEGSGSLGYCAPFKAQTKLLKKMVSGEPFEQHVSIGTVHTFQGDEKNTMIFDTVNSLGEKHFLHPPIAQEHASKSNLLTVAVSRAQNRLIFLANLRYLDTKIPATGYLRKILYEAQSKGTVVDARDVIDLVPLREELEKVNVEISGLEISAKALKSGLINEDTFFPLVKADISKAAKYIAIYSGFYTPNRVNDLLPILIKKIHAGVKVRIIVPPPNMNGSMSETDSVMVVEKLALEGVLVEFRARIHQKAVLIDGDVAWFGSLNPLSFSGATEESMLRVQQRDITGIFAVNMAVNRNSAKDDPSLMVAKEVPDCSYCGAQTVFSRGKYGPYVRCLNCQKTENLRW